MFHNAVRVLVIAGFVGIGWAVGHAQAPAQTPSGRLEQRRPLYLRRRTSSFLNTIDPGRPEGEASR